MSNQTEIGTSAGENKALNSDIIILLVTQDQEVLDATRTEFSYLGRNLLHAQSAEACNTWTSHIRPSLIILDADLPDVTDCYSTNLMSAPLVMLGSCAEEMACVEVFELGAEDCITKPIRALEYACRIHNVLKRHVRSPEPLPPTLTPDSLSINQGDFQIDAMLHSVVVRDKPVHMSPDEFKVLFLLASNSDRIVSAKEIAEYVWHENGEVSDKRRAVLHLVVSKLRKAIERNPLEPVHLLNVYRTGYKFRF